MFLIAIMRLPKTKSLWILVAVLMGLTAVQLGWMSPALLNQGQGWPFSFAALHGTASAIHGVMILLALAVSWKLSR